jgi:serine/threonine protein kinase
MSDRERHVNRILAEALKLPGSDRLAYVEEQCGPDRDLYLEVASLLQHHHTADKSFDLPELPVSKHEQRPIDRLRLERFEVGELISEGGMGKVFEGRQISPERRVAIKVLSPALSSNTKAAEYFVREAAVLAKLDHQSIVKVIESGECDGTLFMVMEYVAGEDGGPPVTLRDVLDRGPMEPGRVRAILLDITSALGFAHKQGFVHRDIKPSNILIDRHGKARIVDFGIASVDLVSRKLTTGNMVMGTLDYMSPEQKTNTGVVGGQSDVFSLGVVLCEMLTGKLPHGAFEPPSTCRPELGTTWDEVVRRALEYRCERRFRTMEEFREALPSLKSAPVPLRDERVGQAVRGPESGSAEVAVLEGHTGLVTTLAFGANSKRIVSAGWDKVVRVWNLSTGERVDWEGHTDYVNCVAIDPLGRWCASGSDDQTIRLWPLIDGLGVLTLNRQRAEVESVDFSVSGKQLISCSCGDDMPESMWQLLRTYNRVQIWDICELGETRSEGPVRSDGNQRWEVVPGHVLIGRMWDNWKLLRAEVFVARFAEFLPEGVVITKHDGGWVRWGGASKCIMKTATLSTSDPRLFDKWWRVSPDLSKGIFSDRSGTPIYLESLAECRRIQDFFGHNGRIADIAVTSDWSRLVSSSCDGTVRVWEMGTGKEIERFVHPGLPGVLRISPDNRVVAVATGYSSDCEDNDVRVWRLPT